MKKRNNPTAQHTRIVIVDDDQAVRNALKFSLEIDGFDVRTYEHAEKLLSEAEFPACRCLVIDQKLPGMSGIDLISKLRERDVYVPAILITTHPGAALKQRAAIAHIPIVEKPLLGSMLLDSINQILKRPSSLSH
jgi:two-component system, LuxR family, response regulator FixJ